MVLARAIRTTFDSACIGGCVVLAVDYLVEIAIDVLLARVHMHAFAFATVQVGVCVGAHLVLSGMS